jgi:hypothetical protein
VVSSSGGAVEPEEEPSGGPDTELAGALAGALDRLRALCLALPEATERLSHGEPTWFVRDRKVFVTFAGRHHDDRVACWCAAAADERDALVGEDPERFFVPPYVGGRGWLGVYLDVDRVDWAELGEIVREAYRLIAPKRLATLLD